MHSRVRIFVCVFSLAAALPAVRAAEPVSLSEALTVLKSHRFVDLTHSFAPGIPHWKGAPNERVKSLYTVEKDTRGCTRSTRSTRAR
jgi:hypothetical protein